MKSTVTMKIPSTMKAAVYLGNDQMVVKEVPVPAVDDDSALLRVRACAVCGSDIRIFHSGNSRVTPPQILGHEISGEVVKVGKNVTKIKAGDRVAIGADVPCGECFFCKAGIGNNCQINYAMGYQFAGGFAEYMPLNRTVMTYGPVTKIPGNVSFDEAALAEPLACVLNAVEVTPIKFNDTLVVIGAGPIGLMIGEVAKNMGAARNIYLDRNQDRLNLAKKIGIADVIVNNTDTDGVDEVLALTNGIGANVIYTANPSPAAQPVALRMAVNRGRISFFGGLPKNNSMVTLDTNVIHYKELLVSGAHGSMPQHHDLAVQLIASGRIDVKKFMTHRFALDNILDGIKAAENYTGLRVIINP